MVGFGGFKEAFRFIFVTVLVIAVLLIVSSFLVAMPLGLALFFLIPEGLAISKITILRVPFQLFMIYDFDIPIVIDAGMLFTFLWIVYILCFAAAWKLRESLRDVIEKRFSRPTDKLFNNFLFAMPIITGMLLTAVVFIEMFQRDVIGMPPSEPSLPKDPFLAFLNISYAPVVEELSFRVSPIGIFLIIYLFSAGRKTVSTLSLGQKLKLFFLIPLYPEKAKKVVGVKTVSEYGVSRGMSLTEWLMIVFTGLTFGISHYFSPVGWELEKISTASLSGVAFGLVYLIYGVYAPMLLHWFFNYYLWLNYEIILEFYPVVALPILLVELVIIVVGAVGWVAFAILGLSKVFNSVLQRDNHVGV